MPQNFTNLIQQSPLTDPQKQQLLQAYNEHGETQELLLKLQSAVAETLDQTIASFRELENPKLNDLITQAQHAVAGQDKQTATTIKRLAADAEDLMLDAQQYQQDLQTAIEETKKISTKG